MASFLNKLATDLLRLEINTIVKDEILCVTANSYRRELFDLAEEYRAKLIEFNGTNYMYDVTAEDLLNEQFRQRTGGELGFSEIVEYCDKKIELFTNTIEAAPDNEDLVRYAKECKIMASRIKAQSLRIIDVLELQKELYPDQEWAWNNDYPEHQIDKIADLPLEADQIAIIRKASEIGTQHVVLQTVVQLQGDITSYMTNRFLRHSEREQKMMIEMHQESISTGIRMWQGLFKAIGSLASGVFDAVTRNTRSVAGRSAGEGGVMGVPTRVSMRRQKEGK
jgi:hypothetical protein